jgi:8-amino-7-oxononanoate synthase
MTTATSDEHQQRAQIAETVFQEVRRVVPEGLSQDPDLVSSLSEIGLDSLQKMDVVNALEEAFGMRFKEEWLYDMETCGDLVACIEANVSGKEVSGKTAVEGSDSEQADREIKPEDYDVELFPECVAFLQRLGAAKLVGLKNPFFRVNESACDAIATIGGKEMIRYTSFDYAGMSSAPSVRAAAKEAIDRFGTSASASRLVGGDFTIVEDLETELAEFLGVEEAIVMPSGYGTNASLFGHLFGEEDLIVYDELAHNSIMNGAALSDSRRRSFPHNDYESLDRLLRDVRKRFRRVVIAMEGVYSMDGDYPDLPKFLDVKKRHQALLYVDEAHSIGVMGDGGRGICEHFGVDPGEGDLWMGTISKGLGSGGGYLAGRSKLMTYLKYTTPAMVFATGTSPANAAAALAALRLIKSEPQRVARLRENAALFLQLAKDAGLNTGNSQDTPIIPIILGDSARCVEVSQTLLENGVDAQPILYPAVPEKASRVRFFITANHTEEQIRHTVDALTKCLADG